MYQDIVRLRSALISARDALKDASVAYEDTDYADQYESVLKEIDDALDPK